MPKNFPGTSPNSHALNGWDCTDWPHMNRDLGSRVNVTFTKLELGRTQLEKKGSVIVLGGGREPLFGPMG